MEYPCENLDEQLEAVVYLAQLDAKPSTVQFVEKKVAEIREFIKAMED